MYDSFVFQEDSERVECVKQSLQCKIIIFISPELLYSPRNNPELLTDDKI